MDLQICVGCGHRFDRPVVAPDEPILICTVCGHRQPFRRLPLFALTGPSGAGKSTVGRLLAGPLDGAAVIVEQDVLWTAGLQDPTDDFRQFRSTWLRMAAMIHQSGRPVVLVGTVVPVQFEECPERAYFSEIHYLALVCAPDVLRARLLARPAWRGWGEDRIAETLAFDAWLRTNASTLRPPVQLIDTTVLPLDHTVDAVATWALRGCAATRRLRTGPPSRVPGAVTHESGR